jgi:hypothetical protein
VARDDEVYTPVTPEFLQMMQRMRAEYGTWRAVAAASGVRTRILRNLHKGRRKAVSHTMVDKLCSTTGVGGVHEFTWFTLEDLFALGIWVHPKNGQRWVWHKGKKRKVRMKRKERLAYEKALDLKRVNKRRYRYGLPPITKRRYGPFS